MAVFPSRRWLLVAVVLVAIAAGSTVAVATASTAGSTSTAFLAECTASPTTVTLGENVTLAASNSTSTRFVEFDKEPDGEYDDGFDETDFIVNVSYGATGTYEPRVRANGDSADTISCGEVTVVANKRPTANFTFRPDPGVQGQEVEFDASTSTDDDGEVVRYHWDWDGDEQFEDTTTNATINHTFFGSGTQTVVLQVEDDDGGFDFTSRDVEIVEPTVTARCSVDPQTTVVDQNVTFDATASENKSYLDYDFDGDGEYDLFEATDFVETHSFPGPGNYTAEITVYSGYGQSDTADCPTVDVQRANEPPQASFTYSPNPGIAGQPVTFDASASTSGDPDGEIVEYRWDFGTTARTTTDPVVNETFFSTGFQPVDLTVVDDQNATGRTGADVEVVAPNVVARCSVDPRTVTAGQSVLIDARASENASFIDYDFQGDAEFDRFEERNFTWEHVYEEPGEYVPIIRVYGTGDQRDIEECGTVTVEPRNEPPEASFTWSPDPGIAGQSMTFDASTSGDPDGDIVEYRWDWDGDGEYENSTDNPQIQHTYFDIGFRNVGLQVIDEQEATATTIREVEVVQPELSVECGVEPATVEPGESVTIFVEAGENAAYLDYDYDGDGEFDRFETREFATSTSYDEPGTYTPLVRVYTGTGSREVFECTPVTVEEPNEPPTAAFVTDPETPEPGTEVTFDGSNSTDSDGTITTYSWDFDGDGEIDQNTTGPTVTHTYDDAGDYVPRLVVVDDDNATGETRRDLVVERPATTTAPTTTAPPPTTPEEDEEEEGLPPWWPIPAVGGGLLGLGGLAWYLFGGGGGAGGGSGGKPTPKPKPRPQGTAAGGRYETGVFEIPRQSGTITVPVGFEPDLILFSAANGARTDTAADRTAGWSRGMAHRTGEGVENQSLTVADDAHEADQATCAADADLALQLVRHEAEGPPGRVTAAVTTTTSNGFEVDVSVPGDDPLAGGIRVLYQAFRTGADVQIEAGTVMTPTEPGTQTVDLGIEADHVSLSVSAAVADDDQLWTTDRGVGLSVGHAVAEPEARIDQAVGGTSAWPGTGHPTAGISDDASALHLLYQDGDRLAGRTSASATALGQTLRLQYDRVYNGPHKLGSIARHPISYLAMNGGETMRPAVGAFSLPRPGERQMIDCGFQPELIEVQIAPAPLGEELASGATPHPFGWSQGTAITDEDRLRQYVLNHAVVPDQPDATASGAATDTARSGTTQASTDGGQAASGPAVGADQIAGQVDVRPREKETAAASSPDPETGQAPAAAEHSDDGRAGLWLATGPDGTIVGRDELHVTGVTETGFRTAVESVDTDRRGPTGARPTVVYRAWPAVDVSGAPESQRTERPPDDTRQNVDPSAPAGRGADTTAPAGTQNVDTTAPTDVDVEGADTEDRR